MEAAVFGIIAFILFLAACAAGLAILLVVLWATIAVVSSAWHAFSGPEQVHIHPERDDE